MIRAAFFDIDGTLVPFSTHRMTAAVRDCLMDLRQKGVKLFISTGRPPSFVNNLDDFPFDGYIYMNGSLVVCDGTVLVDSPVDRQTCCDLTRICVRENIPAYVFTKDSFGINCMNAASDYMRTQIGNPEPPIVDIEELARTEKIYEFTVFMDKGQEDSLLRPVLGPVEYPRWYPTFMDIIPEGLSKAAGAAAILDHYGIPVSESIAFGDGGNDIPIISFAGIGVAMGNADESVRAVADYVTSAVEDDGIVMAFRHFGLY